MAENNAASQKMPLRESNSGDGAMHLENWASAERLQSGH